MSKLVYRRGRTRGDEETIPILVDALGDKSPRVRLGALRGLYKLNTGESMSSLLDALRDEHPDIRASAATYLGWSGNVALSLFSTPLTILFQFDAPQVNPRIRQAQRLDKLALKLG
ncbi:MAG: HEAT repeat domain-containing protein [bacterium]